MGGAKAVRGHHVLVVVGALLAAVAVGCSKKAPSPPLEESAPAPYVAPGSTSSGPATTSRSSAQTFGPTDASHAAFCRSFDATFTFGPLDTTDDPEEFTSRLNDRLAGLDELAGFAPPEVRANIIAVREAMARARNGRDIDDLLNDPTFQAAKESVNRYIVHCGG